MRERRQCARLVEAVNFKIGYEVYDLSSTTINLSSNGLLCRIHQEVPVMTKIDMALLVPGSGQNQPKKIRAKGVVVRVEPDAEGLFKMAVFFTEISEPHRRLLHTFISNKINHGKGMS